MTLIWKQDIRAEDLNPLANLVAGAGVFTAEEITVAAELAEARLLQGDASGYQFILAFADGLLAGYSCFGRIPLTEASYDLYWIVVGAACRNQGVATALLARTENRIHESGGRHLYAETSSRDIYTPAQSFYLANGFAQMAHFPDFYREGDGKLVYGKKLARIE
jgi:ribosomal protein S18 acetylase RimI-like enzyme